MTEIDNGWQRRPRQAIGEPKQLLVDPYHPEFPIIKPTEKRKQPSIEIPKISGGRSAYLEAKDRRDQEILLNDPHAILPHDPCG